MRRQHLIVWASAVVVIACLVAAVLYVDRENDMRRDAQIASCERGNTIRHTLNLIVVHVGLADDVAPLPVVACAQIIR